MGIIDIERLLSPVSEEAPCGEDLEYDTVFMEVARDAQGAREDGMISGEGRAEEPDWRSVRTRALELCERTRGPTSPVRKKPSGVKTSSVGGYTAIGS